MPKALRPKYWPAWLCFGVLRLLVLLPVVTQLSVGRALGRLLKRALPSRDKIVSQNLALCFPNKSAQERAALNTQVFESMGMFFMEGNIAYNMNAKRFDTKIKLSEYGFDHLREAMASGQGVMVLSGHMMVLEIIGRLFAKQFKLGVVYRRNNSPFYDLLINRGRAKFIDKLIDRKDIKGMIKWLRAGNILWYAPDQDFGPDRSVFADFMGVPTATVKAIADLGRLGKAAVIPCFFARENTKGQYAINFLPALDNFPSGDYVKDLQRYNSALGDYVKLYPEQYNWLHRRFKTRPEGAEWIYK